MRGAREYPDCPECGPRYLGRHKRECSRRRRGPVIIPWERRWATYVSPEPNTGCWLWTGHVDRRGYGHFWIDGRRWKTHRFAWRVEHGAIPRHLHACHRCDTPACVNPAHLFLGTDADNNADARRKGRAWRPDPRTLPRARGERIASARVTAATVVAIRADRDTGLSERALAAKYGLSRTGIRHIVNRETWRHI